MKLTQKEKKGGGNVYAYGFLSQVWSEVDGREKVTTNKMEGRGDSKKRTKKKKHVVKGKNKKKYHFF